MKHNLTPSEIVQALDSFIIGQNKAKKAVAIALRNRWRRMEVDKDLRKEIVPNNILMIGPTGVGKTEIARRLAQLAQAPFVKVEASKFTEVGYVGRDVESMVRDLVEKAVNLVKEEKKASIKEEARKRANGRILDILIPKIVKPEKVSNATTTLDPGLTESANNEKELNDRTRAKFEKKLLSGELEGREIEVNVKVPQHNIQIMGPLGGMDGMSGLQDMLSGMGPKKEKVRKLKIKDAREVFMEAEYESLLDMDAVDREACERASQSGIIFIDEIDKIATGSSRKGGADVSREGVQRDLLPIIEGSVVKTKHGSISTDHVLFIAAGAFHVSKPSDLIPELQGRLPIRVELDSLTQGDFVRILQEPENALIKQYAAILEAENVRIKFTKGAIEEIAQIAFNVNQEVENIGARRLYTIMSNLLEDILFNVPDIDRTPTFSITVDFVRAKLSKISQDKDLSHYIL